MTMVHQMARKVGAVLCGYCRRSWLRCKVTFLSLFYNDHCNFSYAMDTMMEPMIWFVDNYVKYLGPAFVGFLIGMMGMVIVITYMVIVPYEWQRKSYAEIVFYFIIGHWLLISVVFHYCCAYTTKPGYPPVGRVLLEAVGMCKHCIAPKPPRTHHCRVCNRCILKMDHHCPWLNQCVGHYNHRYFFCTMFFMWLGCLFIVIGSWPSFIEHYWTLEGPVAPWCLIMKEKLSYGPYLCRGEIETVAVGASDRHLDEAQDPSTSGSSASDAQSTPQLQVGGAAKTCILFVFFTAAAVVVGIGALMVWHMRLIVRGETSIEQHINKQTRQRFEKEGKIYVNPYDFGWRGNIRRFLGLNASGRSFWRHVILPSRHKPVGDGLTWESTTFEIRHELDSVNLTKRVMEAKGASGTAHMY